MRVVLDTSVLLAAFAARGLCEALLAACLQSDEIVLSEHILGECAEHLSGTMEISSRQTRETVEFLRDHADIVEPDELPRYPPGFKPRLAETVRMLGDQLSHDYATNQATMIELVNYFREQLPPEQFARTAGHMMSDRAVNLSKYRPVEVMLFAPSRRIQHSDSFKPELFDQDLKDTSTVLRFHKDFIGKMIGFGYEDATTRHDELAEFFNADRPQRPSMFSEAVTAPIQ